MDCSGDDARNPQQEAEWREAQSIFVTPDLVSVAKAQLLFLAAVDRHRALYSDGPVLRTAIRRYKECWLPLLAKHQQQNLESDAPLVVPLDCEWIWHCHRLNPVRYKKDCESVYGRLLDNANVQSTTGATVGLEIADQMRKLWEILYPGEPFEIEYAEDPTSDVVSDADPVVPDAATFDYDFVAAVRRQSSFYYQVSRPTVRDKRFLEAAVARYKGFLHLIRRNHEKSLRQFSVPTYDVDIIWHSHQLQPLSYCGDLTRLIGRVLEHDDTDSDRSKGQKLDVGFTQTTKLWEETFGSRYWRAGAMYRGGGPSPVVNFPCKCTSDVHSLPSSFQKHLQLHNAKFVEVFLEVLDVKNAPDHEKGALYVSFGKNHQDPFFNGDSSLNIQSETGQREVASFRCDPTGDLVLTVLLERKSFLPVITREKTIGTVVISLQDIIEGNSEPAMERWFELKLKFRRDYAKHIFLRVAASFTLPAPAPHTISLAKLPRISRSPCFSAFSVKGCSRFIDNSGKELLRVSMRFLKNKGTDSGSSLKQVVGFLKEYSKTQVLAEFVGDAWSFIDFKMVLSFVRSVSEDSHIFELQSEHMLKLFPGQRLEFEARTCDCTKQKHNCDFITVVQFSVNEPYGKALALINVKSGILKVNEEWFVLPGLVLTFILWSTLKAKGYGFFIPAVASHD